MLDLYEPRPVTDMPREYLIFIEAILRRHPYTVRQLAECEDLIDSLCGGDATPRAGSDRSNNARRYVSSVEKALEAREDSTRYQELNRRVMMVSRALERLEPFDRKYIELYFWQDATPEEMKAALNMDRTEMWVQKMRILKKVAPHIIREWWDDEIYYARNQA